MGLRPSIVELTEALSGALGGARIEGLLQLSSGASRETWAFDADGRALVLQRQTAAPDGIRLALSSQAEAVRAAGAHGVPVPSVVCTPADARLGDSIIVERIDGETIPRKILRDDAFAGARVLLAGQCAEALACIHSIEAHEAPSLEHRDEFALFRRLLDDLGEPHPAFELAFRWLEHARPAGVSTTVVHGDFRNGNLIVGADGLRAVIDWELCHVGDPMEDLGWLCVKSWRFGDARPVGGFGTREEFLAAYEIASGRKVDPDAVHWWEVFGNVRWGVICIMQAMRHLSGGERSIELATVGRRVAEVEHDVMLLLP